MYAVNQRNGRSARAASSVARVGLLVGLLATLSGCQTLTGERQAREREPSGLLLGRISAPAQVSGPFIVQAIDRRQGTITQRMFIERQGAFEMPIAVGTYKFVAFADRNRDGRLGRSEPVSIRMSLDSPIRDGDVLALPTLDIRAP
jgi:hypothetical protein